MATNKEMYAPLTANDVEQLERAQAKRDRKNKARLDKRAKPARVQVR